LSRKKQADRKLSSPGMAKLVCDRLPTLSSKHPSGNKEGFVIAHITKKVDTNNVCCGQRSFAIPGEDSFLSACFFLLNYKAFFGL
jgi:hypothetical protein